MMISVVIVTELLNVIDRFHEKRWYRKQNSLSYPGNSQRTAKTFTSGYWKRFTNYEYQSTTQKTFEKNKSQFRRYVKIKQNS